MSAETDFRALLAGHAPLFALVSGRIALNAVPQSSVLPIVVFTSRHQPQINLLGDQVDDEVIFLVQCWAESAAAADAVADAVVGALATAPDARAVAVLERSTGYDNDLKLDATLLSVSWWA